MLAAIISLFTEHTVTTILAIIGAVILLKIWKVVHKLLRLALLAVIILLFVVPMFG